MRPSHCKVPDRCLNGYVKRGQAPITQCVLQQNWAYRVCIKPVRIQNKTSKQTGLITVKSESKKNNLRVLLTRVNETNLLYISRSLVPDCSDFSVIRPRTRAEISTALYTEVGPEVGEWRLIHSWRMKYALSSLILLSYTFATKYREIRWLSCIKPFCR